MNNEARMEILCTQLLLFEQTSIGHSGVFDTFDGHQEQHEPVFTHPLDSVLDNARFQ